MTFNRSRLTLAVTFGAFLTGCASNIANQETVFELNQPNRIIYHDFRIKYDVVGPRNPTTAPQEQSSNIIPTRMVPASLINDVDIPKEKVIEELPNYVDVEFFNESAVVRNPDQTTTTIKEVIGSKKILIVGHSHGHSEVGVESLASKRARYVADLLFLAGVSREDMYFMSSWSDGGKPYEMARGVRVVGLPEDISSVQALLTGLNQNRSNTNET